MKELYFNEVLELCHKLNIHIKGIFCRDQIPNDLQNEWIIINLDKHTGSGTHYTAFYRGKQNLYFDSFGMPACEELENKYGKNYIYNHKQIQSMTSDSCGWFCIACIGYCEKYGNTEHSFHSFLDLFTDKVELNEKILESYFK